MEGQPVNQQKSKVSVVQSQKRATIAQIVERAKAVQPDSTTSHTATTDQQSVFYLEKEKYCIPA